MEDLLVSWHEETCVVNLLEAVKYRNSCQDLWDLSSCVNTYWLLRPNPQQSTLVNSWVVRLFVSIQVSSVLIPQTTIFQFLLSTKHLRIDSQVFSISEKSVEVTEKPECPEPETEPENESPVKKKSGKKSKGEKKLLSVDRYSWSFLGWKKCQLQLSHSIVIFLLRQPVALYR